MFLPPDKFRERGSLEPFLIYTLQLLNGSFGLLPCPFLQSLPLSSGQQFSSLLQKSLHGPVQIQVLHQLRQCLHFFQSVSPCENAEDSVHVGGSQMIDTLSHNCNQSLISSGRSGCRGMNQLSHRSEHLPIFYTFGGGSHPRTCYRPPNGTYVYYKQAPTNTDKQPFSQR
ncbi:uncharacterized protein KNAG_0L00510 [Huiozyma naganishii CBS 8797]|uniref:Uncharacterized protein n=1 Tax=Huiozyma naganishii (strain ATCC MYA-139 / BCRC 22969 / CBS 8797 / KCTC 17520 / NBRC 10181 / NCYC 3082 / Yp74L-3) TaxID=1071383 RepID=J7SAE0_HUIN7|nr:hypothetical protein KNAG_0L00510 [Kazachstania naganishii CBS 8797]CCK72674.1 hypothetical protein KNAG_0L00510 [Kazachstania naganishii CBS 8797]